MSRNYTHNTEGKYNNGLIELDDVPQNVRNKWDRHNKSIGKFRKKKKDIEEKQFNKNMKNEKTTVINRDYYLHIICVRTR